MHSTLAGTTLSALALAAAPAAALHVSLLIPDSNADSIGLYDPNGDLLDADFITDANDPATYDFITPVEAIQVGSEIFVSDQIADAIFIFDLAGNYRDRITGGLDNIRGLAAIGNTVYVANAGDGNGAPGPAVVTIDARARSITGSFTRPDYSPYDVEVYQGDLLVTDIEGDGGEGVDRFARDGTFLNRLVNADTNDPAAGPDFPEQVSAKVGDDGFLVAGFSLPSGVYDFDDDGGLLDVLAAGSGPRGVYDLGSGDYLYTTGAGTFLLDPSTDTSTLVGPGTRLIGTRTIPEPATAATLLALGGLGLLRRRRA